MTATFVTKLDNCSWFCVIDFVNLKQRPVEVPIYNFLNKNWYLFNTILKNINSNNVRAIAVLSTNVITQTKIGYCATVFQET